MNGTRLANAPVIRAGSNDGEHQLVGHKDEHRYVKVGREIGGCDVPQQDVIDGIADDPVDIGPEAKGVTHGDPQDRGHPQGHDALHHDGQHVLATHKPAIEEGEARGHDQDQTRRNEHESGVSSIDHLPCLPDQCVGASAAVSCEARMRLCIRAGMVLKACDQRQTSSRPGKSRGSRKTALFL